MEKQAEYRARFYALDARTYGGVAEDTNNWRYFFDTFAKLTLADMLIGGELVDRQVFRARVREEFMRQFLGRDDAASQHQTIVDDACKHAWEVVDAYNQQKEDELVQVDLDTQ